MKSKLKKIIATCLSAALMLLLTSCLSTGSNGPYAGQTLHLYNAGEYLSEQVIEDFEYVTGCRIIQDVFESNEQMYVKVSSGDSYDLLVPSDYMIERLMQEGYLQPLDKSKLPNLAELDQSLLSRMTFDPDQTYAVPYFWGAVGITYDTTQVDEQDLINEGYGIFGDTKYKGNLYLYDSEREMFMLALLKLGYSMNTDNTDELQEAYAYLTEIVSTMDAEIVTDEIIDNMAQGRKAFGLMYSGEAAYVMTENEDMAFFMPESGTNIFMDCMVIPKNAQNVELAHEFINFVSGYEAACNNSIDIGYTSANVEVKNELSGPGGEYEGIDAYVPRTDNPNDEVFHYNEDTRKIMSELWAKVKITASNQ